MIVRAIWEFDVDDSEMDESVVDIKGLCKDLTKNELRYQLATKQLTEEDFIYEVREDIPSIYSESEDKYVIKVYPVGRNEKIFSRYLSEGMSLKYCNGDSDFETLIMFSSKENADKFIDTINEMALKYHEEFSKLELTGNIDYDNKNLFEPFFNKMDKELNGVKRSNSILWCAFFSTIRNMDMDYIIKSEKLQNKS